jgi:UDP-N-acetylmuramoylalanine--D-glutamate ligase
VPEDTAVMPQGFGAVPGGAARVEFCADDELPADPSLPGRHNRENAAAATAAARAAGIRDEAIAEALSTFPGVPHRLELVAELGGVRFVNDSKATNAAAALRALDAYDAPLHVILGGSQKGESFDELAHALRDLGAHAYLIGETMEELAVVLGRDGVPYVRSGDLATAVGSAADAAGAGEVVLLSPACASYDQFRDFEERGEEFRRLVQNLSG